jgi:hypothetical protein
MRRHFVPVSLLLLLLTALEVGYVLIRRIARNSFGIWPPPGGGRIPVP